MGENKKSNLKQIKNKKAGVLLFSIILFQLVNSAYCWPRGNKNRNRNQVTKPLKPEEPLTLKCRFSDVLTRSEVEDIFMEGGNPVPRNERLTLVEEGAKVELNLTLDGNVGEYSCRGVIPGVDKLSINGGKNITVFEKSRQMINDVVSNKDLNIDPTSLRKGEWILTWDYSDRPEIRSIEISYMKNFSGAGIEVSVTFYRGDEAFTKNMYRITDIFIDTDFGIRLKAINENGKVLHEIVTQKYQHNNRYYGPINRADDSIQSRFPSTGMSSEERWKRRRQKVQQKNWEKDTSGHTDEEPNIKFLLIMLGVLFTIINLVAAITKKCGVFYFIYQTCCGPPLDYKRNNDDKEEIVKEEEMVVEQNEKVEEVKEKQTVANVEVYGAEADSEGDQ